LANLEPGRSVVPRPFLFLALFIKCVEEEFCELRLLGILGTSGWGCVAAPVTNNNKRPGPWSPKAPVPTRSGWLELSGALLMPIASASTEQHVAARA
jgi:hypothetical protein